jgi:hypothetical protein
VRASDARKRSAGPIRARLLRRAGLYLCQQQLFAADKQIDQRASCFHSFVEILQIGAVVGRDQRRLHQGGPPQLAALFVNVSATFGLIGIGDARNNAKVTGQPVFIGKVIYVADDAKQNRPVNVADALDTGHVKLFCL